MSETCPACGVLDALGRHAGTCPRAVELGLVRLADGEAAIEPMEDEDVEEAVVAPEDEPTPPGGIIPRPRFASGGKVVKVSPPELWMAYHNDFSGVVIFDSELEALRHAVEASMRVTPLELRRDLREQIG